MLLSTETATAVMTLSNFVWDLCLDLPVSIANELSQSQNGKAVYRRKLQADRRDLWSVITFEKKEKILVSYKMETGFLVSLNTCRHPYLVLTACQSQACSNCIIKCNLLSLYWVSDSYSIWLWSILFLTCYSCCSFQILSLKLCINIL